MGTRAVVVGSCRRIFLWTCRDGGCVLNSRLKVGTFFGIQLYIHWTFALLVGFVAFVSREGGAVGMAYGVATLLGMFLCVTLHEYGHALAARRFQVPTIDITLLPIGGVARLQRMPRVPWQELVVAVAGPAVNVVIALILGAGLAIYGGTQVILGMPADQGLIDRVEGALGQPSWLGFAITMMAVNTILVVFNMIPAFPMDGGRVLRSLLAMITTYRRATVIASRIGLVCAVLMALFAFQAGAPIPVLIALFIGYVGLAEARQVEVMESVRGLTIRGVMIRNPAAVSMDAPLWEVARRWQSLPLSGLPVVSFVDTVTGMLWLKDVTDAIENRTDLMTPAGQLADHEAVVVGIDDDLETVMVAAGTKQRLFPVVDRDSRLVGLLDFDSLLSRGRLSRQLGMESIPEERLNVVS